MNDDLLNRYALVELLGHNRIVGRISEETIAGATFLRVDVPAVEITKPFTKYFGPNSVYAITPLDEQTALRAIRAMHQAPVQAWELGVRTLGELTARYGLDSGIDPDYDSEDDSNGSFEENENEGSPPDF